MKDGDIVWIEYDLFLGEEEELIESTDPEKAEGWGIEAQNGPKAMIIGSEGLLPGIMEALREAEVGEEKSVEIPPEKAYGERDPKLIELHPIPKLKRLGVEVEEGAEVDMKGRKGHIIRLTGSRAWVDFNHPYAGRPLLFRFRIVRKAEGPEEIVRGLLDVFYGKGDEFSVEFQDDVLKITVPDVAKYDSRWTLSKFSVLSEVMERLDVAEIHIVEKYERKKEHEEAGEETGATSEGEETEEGEAFQEGEEPEGTEEESAASEGVETEKEEEPPEKEEPAETEEGMESPSEGEEAEVEVPPEGEESAEEEEGGGEKT